MQQNESKNTATPEEHFKILMIEDHPDDARMVREMLTYTKGTSFDVECVEQLSAGVECLRADEFDVVLLDLSMQNNQGTDALARICTQAPNVPVVALTGTEDDSDSMGLEAVRAGAQDYIVKGWTDGNVLARSIRYAVERQRLKTELERAHQKEQQERELQSLERLSSPVTAVTSRMYGSEPIAQSLPTVFQELSGEYGRLLDLALEQQAFKVEHDISAELNALAERMGSLRAGPRDVIDIHSQATRTKIHEATAQKAKAYLEEGRLMVLKLMGYLASHYRSYACSTGMVAHQDEATGQMPDKVSRNA